GSVLSVISSFSFSIERVSRSLDGSAKISSRFFLTAGNEDGTAMRSGTSVVDEHRTRNLSPRCLYLRQLSLRGAGCKLSKCFHIRQVEYIHCITAFMRCHSQPPRNNG